MTGGRDDDSSLEGREKPPTNVTKSRRLYATSDRLAPRWKELSYLFLLLLKIELKRLLCVCFVRWSSFEGPEVEAGIGKAVVRFSREVLSFNNDREKVLLYQYYCKKIVSAFATIISLRRLSKDCQPTQHWGLWSSSQCENNLRPRNSERSHVGSSGSKARCRKLYS